MPVPSYAIDFKWLISHISRIVIFKKLYVTKNSFTDLYWPIRVISWLFLTFCEKPSIHPDSYWPHEPCLSQVGQGCSISVESIPCIMLPIVVALLLPPKWGCLESPWNKSWSVASGKAPIPLYASTTRILCDSLMLQLSGLQLPSLCLRWLGTTLYHCNFLSFSGNCVLPWIMEITLCPYLYIC